MSDFPEINEDSCRLCGSCVQACAAGALKINKEQPKDSAADNSKGIWVWAEVENGQLAPVSIELLGKAVELSENLAQPVEAVLIGNGVSGMADDLIAYGADSVHVVDSPLMADFIDENYTKVFERLIRQNRPAILLMGQPCSDAAFRHALPRCFTQDLRPTALNLRLTKIPNCCDRYVLLSAATLWQR